MASLAVLVLALGAGARSAEGAPEFVQCAEMTDPGPATTAPPCGWDWLRRLAEASVQETVTDGEYFLLAPEVKTVDGRPARSGGGLALIAQRRVVRGDERLLEREVLFEEGGLRVLHTERIRGNRRTLTYRELQPSGARTWLAEWDVSGGDGRILGYGWHRPTHERFVAHEGLVGPLELLENLRAAGPGQVADLAEVLDPLAANASQLKLEVMPGSGTQGTIVRAARSDGTLVVEARMEHGTRLLDSLRLTGGSRVAKAISRAEFEQRHALWNRPRVPAHERALAELSGRR